MKGRVGMTFADDMYVRKRPVTSVREEDHELGDPLGGDWGGKVVVENRR